MTALAMIILGYLSGSISAGILVARLMGLGDPRDAGSGNPGATNLLRLGGRKAAIITLLVDAAKGLIPVLAAQALQLESLWLALVGLAAFLGHLYPVFFGFRGGKGIATGFGVMLGWHWLLGAAGLLTWVLVAAAFRMSSLSALLSFALAPVYLLLLTGDVALTAAMALMAVITAWRHRENIQRILRGEEPKIGKR
mgnify:CR=1 FL=1